MTPDELMQKDQLAQLIEDFEYKKSDTATAPEKHVCFCGPCSSRVCDLETALTRLITVIVKWTRSDIDATAYAHIGEEVARAKKALR